MGNAHPVQSIIHVTLVVRDYDEAIRFYTEKLLFNQTGGRVFLFLGTDDFWRDYDRMVSAGVTFRRPPKVESYGTVAVFEDLYGNLWDLLQLSR